MADGLLEAVRGLRAANQSHERAAKASERTRKADQAGDAPGVDHLLEAPQHGACNTAPNTALPTRRCQLTELKGASSSVRGLAEPGRLLKCRHP